MCKRLSILTLLCCMTVPALADHPWGKLWLPRFEPLDWVEKLEPKNYRARYNRPRYVAGKIAHFIAPSSQEAMAWHEHVHRGSYKHHAGPIFKTFNYPKPWEALQVGPRSQYPVVESYSTMPEQVISDVVVEKPEITQQSKIAEF